MTKDLAVVCDATLFHNEFEILDFRLRYLEPQVSRFFIAESRLTFSGLERTLKLKNYIETFPRKLQEKIEVVEVQFLDVELDSPWAIEAASRNYLIQHVVDMQKNCNLIFSDLDEIPSLEQLSHARDPVQPSQVQNIPMNVSYRKANWMFQDTKKLWKYPKLIALTEFKNIGTLNNVREFDAMDLAGEPGIHLSYIGMSQHSIKEKYQAFSHTELNSPKYYDENLIAKCDQYRISHLGDARKSGMGLLSEAPTKSFGSIQKHILVFKPDWIANEVKKPSLLRRIYVTIVVTKYLENALSQESHFKFKPSRDLKWFFEFLFGQVLLFLRKKL